MFFLYGATALIGGEDNVHSLIAFHPQKVTMHFKNLDISSNEAFQIDKSKYVLTGTNHKNDSENDYGIRLFVIERNNVMFISKGMMDSWYLNLTFFRPKAANNRILILGESGDEGGSYGFAVYEMDNSQVRNIGYIDASVWDGHENILSAVPFVQIAEKPEGYIFTFTKDVFVRDKIVYEYKSTSKQSIKYVYDRKEGMKRIIE